LLIRWKQPRVNWEASWLAHLVRLAEVRIDPSRCQICVRFVRSPHALTGHMVVLRMKSKKIAQCSIIACIAAAGNCALTNFLQSHFQHSSLEENSDETGATG
jgi:uncharacterized membrane protein YeiB